MCESMYVRTYICMYVCTYICMYVYMYVCMYVYVSILSSAIHKFDYPFYIIEMKDGRIPEGITNRMAF